MLQRIWQCTDPESRTRRRCDAVDRETEQQALRTNRGTYWMCSQTGQLERQREKIDLAQHYDEEWSEKSSPDRDHRRAASYQRWLARLEPYRQTGRLFEVGTGQGLFLRTAAAAGWEASGTELSPFAAQRAREVSGATVFTDPAETVPLEDGTLDVVLLNNVLEHLAQPRLALIRLSRALRPGGAMFLQTLNAQSLCLARQPFDWKYFHEGHLFIPTLISLDAYFAAAGLRTVRRSTHGYHSVPRRKLRDKLTANVAGRLGLGHRVKCVVERSG